MNGRLTLHYAMEYSGKLISVRVKLLAVGLLLLDLLLLGANVLHHVANASDADGVLMLGLWWPYWAGGPDGSVIELAGHLMMLIAAAILILLGVRVRTWLYTSWAAVLTVMVLDNFFLLHERTGDRLARATGTWSVLGLRSQDIGQLLLWLFVAAVLGTLLLWVHFRSGGPARRDSYLLFGCVALLAIFAVGVDLAHAVLDSELGSTGNGALNLLETAGELIIMSAILSVLILARRSPHAAADDHGPARAPLTPASAGS